MKRFIGKTTFKQAYDRGIALNDTTAFKYCLKHLMEKENVNAYELSKLLKISPATIGNYLGTNAKNTFPSPTNFKKLSNYFFRKRTEEELDEFIQMVAEQAASEFGYGVQFFPLKIDKE